MEQIQKIIMNLFLTGWGGNYKFILREENEN